MCDGVVIDLKIYIFFFIGTENSHGNRKPGLKVLITVLGPQNSAIVDITCFR